MSPPVQRPVGAVPGRGPSRSRRWALWLLLIPFVALLYPPLYAHNSPRLVGIPFFIWYQFAWVILGGLLTGVVYVLRGFEGRAP